MIITDEKLNKQKKRFMLARILYEAYSKSCKTCKEWCNTDFKI